MGNGCGRARLCGHYVVRSGVKRKQHSGLQTVSRGNAILSAFSSGSIVSGYGLDDRTIEVRSPEEAKDFSCNLCVQTGSGAHPASCTMVTGGPFPGGKARPGRDVDHSPPSND
jgi:hypothetical protein